jgi:hypothetical protein
VSSDHVLESADLLRKAFKENPPPTTAERQEMALRILTQTTTFLGVQVGLRMAARATVDDITTALDRALADMPTLVRAPDRP